MDFAIALAQVKSRQDVLRVLTDDAAKLRKGNGGVTLLERQQRGLITLELAQPAFGIDPRVPSALIRPRRIPLRDLYTFSHHTGL